MHRLPKYAAVGIWPLSVALFITAAVSSVGSVTRYNIYAFGVLLAFVASTLSVVAALESIVARVAARELAKSRETLAETVADALADELERRGEVSRLYRVR